LTALHVVTTDFIMSPLHDAQLACLGVCPHYFESVFFQLHLLIISFKFIIGGLDIQNQIIIAHHLHMLSIQHINLECDSQNQKILILK